MDPTLKQIRAFKRAMKQQKLGRISRGEERSSRYSSSDITMSKGRYVLRSQLRNGKRNAMFLPDKSSRKSSKKRSKKSKKPKRSKKSKKSSKKRSSHRGRK